MATVAAPFLVGQLQAAPVDLVHMKQSQAIAAASSQTGTAMPTFDVASIKPNKSGTGFGRFGFPPGARLSATNGTLREFISAAYGTPMPIDRSRVIGGPSWIDSERFDIEARAAAGSDIMQMLKMLQSLLAERFNLVLRHETRTVPMYAIVLARKDGTLGSQMKSSVPCGPGHTEVRAADDTFCGIGVGPGRMEFGGMTMQEIAGHSWLTAEVHRNIVDRTGLTGAFRGVLTWTPSAMSPPPGATAPDTPTVPMDGPSVFTAIQEQLGLKFESIDGPIEVLVIERVEHLKEN